VAKLEPLRVPGRAEPRFRAPGLAAPLRALFSGPAWGRRPEPQVRFAQPFLPGLPLLGRQHVGEARAVLERADAIRGRRFTHDGLTVGFPGRIDWDPAGLPESWRIAFSSLGDLIPLGVAAALAQSNEARRGWYGVATAFLREWLAAAAPGRGLSWTPPALLRRIPNLIYAYHFFGPELRADPSIRRLTLESLSTQASHLAAAMAGHAPDVTFVRAGRALFMAGRFFDGMEARGWLEAGTNMLWGQLREQVRDDGGLASRNLAEHTLVLADYLEVLALLKAANDDIPIWARKRVKGMADFLLRMLHPDGEIPLFHGGLVTVERPTREVLALAAAILHEPMLATAGEMPGIWPMLVLGEAGRRVYAHLPRQRVAVAEPRALRRSGFYVLPGDPGDVMLLDGSSPPPGGYNGTFGYELSVGGARLIVSAGMGGEPEPWGSYARSGRAHNVVTVSGAEQVVGGRVPTVADVQWVVRDGLVSFTGVHDGFARLSADLRLRHRRRVFCLPGRFWLVCDELHGTGSWEAESFVHFHPGVTLTGVCRGQPSFVAARSDAASVQIVPAGVGEVHLTQGVTDPPQGWYASRPGERHPAPALTLLVAGSLPLVFGYALVPRIEAPATLRFEHDAFRLHATLGLGADEYVLSVVQGDVEMSAAAAQ
jgi:hypothetical protein